MKLLWRATVVPLRTGGNLFPGQLFATRWRAPAGKSRLLCRRARRTRGEVADSTTASSARCPGTEDTSAVLQDVQFPSCPCEALYLIYISRLVRYFPHFGRGLLRGASAAVRLKEINALCRDAPSAENSAESAAMFYAHANASSCALLPPFLGVSAP